MLRFKCPKCDAKMEVDESFAGRGARCPTCGYEFRVPKTGEAAQTRGMVEPAKAGVTTVKVQGETVEILPPLEILAVMSTVFIGLSVLAVLVIGLSRLWAQPWAVGMALGTLLALLSVVMALSAYSSIATSRGRKRGKGLAKLAMAVGGGLFLVNLVGAIVGFVTAAWKPPCEENLRVISVALANYAQKHNGAYPDGHKANLSTLVEEGYLSSADYLTCPAYQVLPGEQTYVLIQDLNNRDFPPEMMLVTERPPYDAHKDGMIRVLLISGKIIKVPLADWQQFKIAQEAKYKEVLDKIQRAKFAPKAGEPPDAAPPAAAPAAAPAAPTAPAPTAPAAPAPKSPPAPAAAPKPAAPAPK